MASGYLDQQRDRVYEDLSGLIKGKVLRSPVYLELFASDAGLFHIPPLVVVRPQSSADVVACLQYCSDRRIPVHARGAGTGCAGESLGPGVVIDFSAYLRRTSVLDPQASYVRVQPGATFDRLQAQLERYQRMLPFDPGHIGVSTLGGAYARCRRDRVRTIMAPFVIGFARSPSASPMEPACIWAERTSLSTPVPPHSRLRAAS
ncbi:MAG TPA: FAD-dependent oxidoreductase [Thermogutta sp.]|nr:FAD-dependent oxidoreductase [Thermogutta sp.]